MRQKLREAEAAAQGHRGDRASGSSGLTQSPGQWEAYGRYHVAQKACVTNWAEESCPTYTHGTHTTRVPYWPPHLQWLLPWLLPSSPSSCPEAARLFPVATHFRLQCPSRAGQSLSPAGKLSLPEARGPAALFTGRSLPSDPAQAALTPHPQSRNKSPKTAKSTSFPLPPARQPLPNLAAGWRGATRGPRDGDAGDKEPFVSTEFLRHLFSHPGPACVRPCFCTALAARPGLHPAWGSRSPCQHLPDAGSPRGHGPSTISLLLTQLSVFGRAGGGGGCTS